MKTENLLGIEVVVRNKNEAKLVRIIEQSIGRMIDWFMIYQETEVDAKRDIRIVDSLAVEIQHLMKALYFMDVTTQSQHETLNHRISDLRYKMTK